MTSTTPTDEQPAAPREDAEAAAVETLQAAAAEPANANQQALTVFARENAEMRTVYAWGRLMYASGFFPDAQSAAQAAVKILAGRELGFTTMQSMTGFHVIDGKVVASAHLMAHAVKRSERYDFRVLEHTDEICALQFYEKVNGEFVEAGPPSVFSIRDAQQAGLTGRKGQMWEKYPRNMLFARAMSNGIAWYAPDVFDVRVYTPDEIRPDLELTDGGDVVDVREIAARPVAADTGDPERREAPRQAPANRSQRRQDERRQARPQQPRPAAEQAPKRKTSGLDFEDVWNVQTLLTWQHERWAGDTRVVCSVLEVATTGEIAAKYGPEPDGFRNAAEKLWNHFDPEGYAAHLAREDDVAEQAREAYAAEDEAPALDDALEAAVAAAQPADEPAEPAAE